MMRKICKVLVNGERFTANCGDLLLDAALMHGVDIPHDCRAGYCGTCRVRIVDGRVFGGEDGGADVVRACQCRVISDLAVEIEDVPETAVENGHVIGLVRLAPTVLEVRIAVPRPVTFRPGQHYKVQFRGFPARCYSPTFPVEGVHDATILRFHVGQVRNGLVSSALGGKIRVGHRVKLTGPLGTAFFRPDHPGRVVLVSSGTGFAPIWSIALAAIVERRDRAMMLVAGARDLRSLYMVRALCKLAPFPNVTIIPVVTEAQTFSNAVRSGRPTDYVLALSSSDVVYAAGAPAIVQAVARMAKAAGAPCYMDPFAPQGSRARRSTLLHRATAWFTSDAPPLVPDQVRAEPTRQAQPRDAPPRQRRRMNAAAPRTDAPAMST
jgi:3-phenylpropionate/trans-cinnamate dioxygenase ferredoxin reductase subunit